jgi:hypothetical protein
VEPRRRGERRPAAARRRQAEVGQAEQPPGSNDSPRIAEYRTATAGSGVGPVVRLLRLVGGQAGRRAGRRAGPGLRRRRGARAWGERTGRSLPGRQHAAAGDVIVWGGRHIGIVENVLPDGRIQTIEGNSSDQVARRTYGADGGGATSYVRLG